MTYLIPSVVSFVVCFLVLRRLLHGRLATTTLDQPNHRSLHATPTPRIGGIGVLAGILGGSMLIGGVPLLLLALLLLLGGFCFLDDRFGLSAALRLPVHLIVAAVWVISMATVGADVATDEPPGAGKNPALFAVDALQQGSRAIDAFLAVADGGTTNWPLLVGLTLALGWMMNLYNFMDGTNGLAGGMAVFGFGAYGVAATLAGQPVLAALAFLVTAAALAFLIFNFDPARVFLGDVGSIPLGFLAGALGLWGWQATAWPVWFALLVFSPFIVDATVTLLRRTLRGQKVWLAHHDHAYQRLVRSGWSHRRLALTAYGLMAACAASALVFRTMNAALVTVGLTFWVVIYVALLFAVVRRWRKKK